MIDIVEDGVIQIEVVVGVVVVKSFVYYQSSFYVSEE